MLRKFWNAIDLGLFYGLVAVIVLSQYMAYTK